MEKRKGENTTSPLICLLYCVFVFLLIESVRGDNMYCYDILSYCRGHRSSSLQELSDAAHLNLRDTKAVVNGMCSEGLLDKPSVEKYKGYAITESGIRELVQLKEDMSNEDAKKNEANLLNAKYSTTKDKKDFRNSLVVAAFSSACTLLFEHLGELIQFIAQFL